MGLALCCPDRSTPCRGGDFTPSAGRALRAARGIPGQAIAGDGARGDPGSQLRTQRRVRAGAAGRPDHRSGNSRSDRWHGAPFRVPGDPPAGQRCGVGEGLPNPVRHQPYVGFGPPCVARVTARHQPRSAGRGCATEAAGSQPASVCWQRQICVNCSRECRRERRPTVADSSRARLGRAVTSQVKPSLLDSMRPIVRARTGFSCAERNILRAIIGQPVYGRLYAQIGRVAHITISAFSTCP